MDVTNATPNQLAEQPAVEESLTSYFQRSATIVRQYADVQVFPCASPKRNGDPSSQDRTRLRAAHLALRFYQVQGNPDCNGTYFLSFPVPDGV